MAEIATVTHVGMASEHEKAHLSKYSPLAAQPWTRRTQTQHRQEKRSRGNQLLEPGSPAVCQSPGKLPRTCSSPPALALRTLVAAWFPGL